MWVPGSLLASHEHHHVVAVSCMQLCNTMGLAVECTHQPIGGMRHGAAGAARAASPLALKAADANSLFMCSAAA